MFFQSIWRRVSDRWLTSKTASRLFAVACFLTVVTTLVLLSPIETQSLPTHSFGNISLTILGVAGAISIVFLWTGMWRFWTQCDASPRWLKRISFLFLLFGLWFGAVLYYLVIYLRRGKQSATLPVEPPSSGRGLTIFRNILIGGWSALFATVALAFAFPKTASLFLRPIANYFVLIPISLMLSTGIYLILRLYHQGVRRLNT